MVKKEEDDFTSLKVAVVGLGLMGGSFALGLRGHSQSIMGIDPNPDAREFALLNKIADMVSADPAELIPGADVIILAAPVSAILDFIPYLPDLHPDSPIVLDLGSTKVKICQALSDLPPRFETIGGHPMCGKAVGGIRHAEAAIFRGAAFAFTFLNHTTPRAQRYAEWLAGILDANPVWLGPDTHDRWVAATSHLPYLLSAALSLATPTEASHLVGPGFLSSSRLATSPSSVMLPILETNRKYVLESIAHFRAMLNEMEAELREEHYARVEAILDKANGQRELLTGLQRPGEAEA